MNKNLAVLVLTPLMMVACATVTDDFGAGLDSDERVGDLSRDEQLHLCAATKDFLEQSYDESEHSEAACGIGAFLSAAVLVDVMDSRFTPLCTQFYQACLDKPHETTQSDQCDAVIFDGCDYTVGEYEACIEASYSALFSGFGANVCEDPSSLVDLQQGPPECANAEQRCPGLKGSSDTMSNIDTGDASKLECGAEWSFMTGDSEFDGSSGPNDDKGSSSGCSESYETVDDGTTTLLANYGFGVDPPEGDAVQSISLAINVEIPMGSSEVPVTVSVAMQDGRSWVSGADACMASVDTESCADGVRYLFTDVSCSDAISAEQSEVQPLEIQTLALSSSCTSWQ